MLGHSSGAVLALSAAARGVPIRALFLSEPVTPWMVGCGAVILCGTALSTGLVRLPSLKATG